MIGVTDIALHPNAFYSLKRGKNYEDGKDPELKATFKIYILLLFLSLVGFLIYFIFLLFKYSCLHFLPTTPPTPPIPHLPPSILPPFGFVHVSFIYVP